MTIELDPSVIVIKTRQRKKIENIDEHFIKSVTERLLHPIVLRREDDQPNPVLVVGGRRLEALKQGGVNPLVENIHFRFFEDLSPEDARIAELEENVKRTDLPWRDYVSAVSEIHEVFKNQNDKWDAAKTGERINLGRSEVYNVLNINKHLDSPVLRDATGVRNALSILQVQSERELGQVVDRITSISRKMFNITPNTQPSPPGNGQSPSSTVNVNLDNRGISFPDGNSPWSTPASDPIPRNDADRPDDPGVSQIILNEDAIKWIATYDGPKFNLIHCDFPFDIRYDSYAKSVTSTQEDYDFSGFWPLTDALVDNINKVCSYTAHIMFWFSMKFYQQTKERLEKISDLYVHDHPLVWLKSDNSGIIPGRDNAFPRRIYETAFLCTRNKRPLVRSIANAYAAPTARDQIHPSQKPEPVLRHFFSGLVDETTDFLDPTCGSGTSVRAAESSKARSVLGLELNKDYHASAEAKCQSHRRMLNIRI